MMDKPVSPKRKNDMKLTLLTCLYFTGVFIGVIVCGAADSESLSAIDRLTGSLLYGRLNGTFWEILASSFSGGAVLLLMCFWLGFSAAGQPIELLVPVFRGMGAGASLSGLYGSFGLAGVGMSAVLVVPGTVISAFALIIGAREALEMSGNLFTVAFSGRSGENLDHRLYFTKFAVLLAMLAVAAAADGVGAVLFSFIRAWFAY